MTKIYKICDNKEWEKALLDGRFEGSTVDLEDGFIHFSTARQVKETAAKHFAGRAGLVLLAIDSAILGDKLRWEPSRGGDLFPHLYDSLPASAVGEIHNLPWIDGNHQFPELTDE